MYCSHGLEDVLSRLCPVRDPRAVPDEVRLDPHGFHPQHCRTGLGVVVNSFRWLTLVRESFGRRRLCSD